MKKITTYAAALLFLFATEMRSGENHFYFRHSGVEDGLSRYAGANSDGIRNGAEAAYAFVLLLLVVLLIHSSTNRMEKQNRGKPELPDSEKNKELHDARIAFFTNIAHEIRTPLSLIKGPVEYILGRETTSREELTENLKVIEKNTNRLLDISNRLLDFRRMETNGFQLNCERSNIFTSRNRMKQAFVNSPAQNIGSIALTRADENFLDRVAQVIHKNLSDVSFNVDHLAGELHMSRSSLHRKIKGVSELTPNDFIQLVRLKKAAELLQDGSYRINEICYLVGFSSSSYFSKSFKKQFGVSPKESRRLGN
jgi:AraC-like DNA-binding protein